MMLPFWDPTIIIILLTILLTMYAQMKVTSTFNMYSKVTNAKGLTGADVARKLLELSGIRDVSVEHIQGQLSDHYDPRSNVIRLSDAVYNRTSIAALSVAAHETGHAIQHNVGYVPLNLRTAIFPVSSIGSRIAPLLIIGGILLGMGTGSFGALLVNIGIVFFALSVLFTIVTLPVEFNASHRAIELLDEYHFLTPEEIVPAKKVLNAAALTYVAAAAAAVLQLIRFVLLANSRSRNR